MSIFFPTTTSVLNLFAKLFPHLTSVLIFCRQSQQHLPLTHSECHKLSTPTHQLNLVDSYRKCLDFTSAVVNFHLSYIISILSIARSNSSSHNNLGQLHNSQLPHPPHAFGTCETKLNTSSQHVLPSRLRYLSGRFPRHHIPHHKTHCFLQRRYCPNIHCISSRPRDSIAGYY